MKKIDSVVKKVIDNAQKKRKITFNKWWERLAQYHALIRFFSEQPNKDMTCWKIYWKRGFTPQEAVVAWDTDCDDPNWPQK